MKKRVNAFRRDHCGSSIARTSMKKFILLVVAVAALIVLPSAGAANPNSVPTGVKLITTFCNCTATIQANTPFFVKKGFIIDSTDTPAEVQQSSVSHRERSQPKGGRRPDVFEHEASDSHGQVLPLQLPERTAGGHLHLRRDVHDSRQVVGTFTSTVEAVNCPYGTVTSGTGTGNVTLRTAPGIVRDV